MADEKETQDGMVEALEKGINEADGKGQISDKELALLTKKKPKGPNSEAFAELRKKIAERKKALDET